MRALTLAATGALAATAGLHVVWAFSPWPLESPARFADVVVGTPESRLPGTGLTLAVAGALGAATVLVGGQGGILPRVAPRRLHRWGSRAVAGVLLVRGVGGLVRSGLLGSGTESFRRMDLALYSPLCLGLAAAVGAIAARGGEGGRTAQTGP